MNLDDTLNVAELAELYGVHRHTVEGWVKDGLPAARSLKPGGPVLAQLRAAVKWVYARQEARAEEALRKAREGDPDEDSSKARKLRAEARLKELTVLEREGKLVKAEDVDASWAQQTAAVRESVMATAGALVQANLVRAGDEAKVEDALRSALRDAVRKMEADLAEVI